MKNTRTTHSSRRRSTTAALLLVAAVVTAGFGVDGDDEPAAAASGTTTPDTTTVTESTDPQGTTPPVEQADGSIIVRDHELAPTCVYRDHELIFDFGNLTALPPDQRAAIDEALGTEPPFTEGLEPIGPLGEEFVGGLDLVRFAADVDPLDAAQQLNVFFPASPNYIVAFAPGWKYAPDDTPEWFGNQVGVPLAEDPVTIAVLDTGFDAGSEAPLANVIVLSRPSVPGQPTTTTTTPSPLQTEVHDGVAAGHGSFIVNELGQLLPGATITAASTGQRYDDDDHRVLPTPEGPAEVVVRDDSTVTAALDALALDGGVEGFDYLNLSFGTYGCTALLEAPITSAEEAEAIPVYMTPLGLRTVLTNWAASSGMEVFAASGNDGHGPNDREIFYPAGWAANIDYEWLHSVASDPRDDVDYSNRGWWVEWQARGTRVVSRLPDTISWGSEGWYTWSGTSFATPCALAAHAAGAPDLEPASMGSDLSATDPFADPYTECLINAVPAE